MVENYDDFEENKNKFYEFVDFLTSFDILVLNIRDSNQCLRILRSLLFGSSLITFWFTMISIRCLDELCNLCSFLLHANFKPLKVRDCSLYEQVSLQNSLDGL